MLKGQSLSSLTSKLLLKLESLFAESKPDLVLAHGDTTTCFATAVSSFYHHIPFFHVEAGLRTRLLNSPFPEEFNRQTVTPIATHHFAPTETEKKNLLLDGVSDRTITVTGSTVHDAVDLMGVKRDLSAGEKNSPLKVVVVTLHRREGVGSLPLLLQQLKHAARARSDAVFVVPVHPNPAVQEIMARNLSGVENIQLTAPMPYPRFLALLLKSSLVITDSGGVQEEAAFLGKRVLLARDKTEREDGVSSGLVTLVGTSSMSLQEQIAGALKTGVLPTGSAPSRVRSASQIIASHVASCL
jgi:UDP-N-acetylglucosamine 2-epimerase (non-hydrolysing)